VLSAAAEAEAEAEAEAAGEEDELMWPPLLLLFADAPV
jgi:hypothetical protein